jgi:hypothetical protein
MTAALTWLAERWIVKNALGPAWAFVRANPMLALCFVLAAWAAVERHQAHKWQSRAEQCEAASRAAAVATKALRTSERQVYQEKAVEADASHRAALAGVRSSTASYISAHRVRKDDISPAQPVSEAGSASVPESMPTGVVMGEADVRTCADLYAYSVSAFNWAQSVAEDQGEPHAGR